MKLSRVLRDRPRQLIVSGLARREPLDSYQICLLKWPKEYVCDHVAWTAGLVCGVAELWGTDL